jgi:hypothetical protein
MENANFVKVVEADEWIIGYFQGYPLMASFKRRDWEDEMTPLVVSDWYCAICAWADREGSQDGEADCTHKALLRQNDPNGAMELSDAELDDDDAWDDYRELAGLKAAAANGTL